MINLPFKKYYLAENIIYLQIPCEIDLHQKVNHTEESSNKKDTVSLYLYQYRCDIFLTVLVAHTNTVRIIANNLSHKAINMPLRNTAT